MPKATKEITIGVVDVEKLVHVEKELTKAAQTISVFFGSGKVNTQEDQGLLKNVRIRCIRGAARIKEALNPKRTVTLPQSEVLDENGTDND